MKTMKKYFIIVLAGIMALTVSCQREILPSVEDMDGYITLNLSVNVPDMHKVSTRAVDPDGGGVQNITLFCFDRYGLFITTVSADVISSDGDVSMQGTFSAKVPDHSAVVHLVGNQNLSYFTDVDYQNMSETEVMSSIEASAGRMIYWARENVADLVPGSTVTLLRNQAKVSVKVSSGVSFSEKGWVVINTNAFGTVAPYNGESGGFVAPTLADPFVTLPEDETKLTTYNDVRIVAEEYFFETENTEDDPVEMIIKGSQNGGEDLYYRVSMIDESGNHIMLMRNHHYIVNIDGEMSYGQSTFNDALTAPATNNVWVSISDSVNEVYDNDFMLSVDHTSIVVGEDEFTTPNTKVLYYTVKNLNGNELTEDDKPEVYWLDGNNVADYNFTHEFNTSTGRGTIIVNLRSMGQEDKREGTLFVKKGRLHRKVKVITVKTQVFEPAWITTNIYGVGTGENVTMMFSIPETCPQELFPMEVLISSDNLDVRNESGMSLPVIKEGDEGYGEPNGIGYKYVLTVTGTGKQRVYLETILEQETGAMTEVTIEADYFESLTKVATFNSDVNAWILLHNLRSYVASTPADDVIYYYLVPQKVNAKVELTTHLGEIFYTEPAGGYDLKIEDATGKVKYADFITPGANDEFLLYSRYLDHNTSMASYHDFDFYPVNSSLYDTGGRVWGFKRNDNGTPGSGAIYHLVTNAATSAEVVRIASNPMGSASVVGGGSLCTGNQYRSAIFELSNFHPFHFAAKINGSGQTVTGQSEEVVDHITLPYEPGASVNIEFDITSFKSTIQGEADQVSVDPFGTEFKVYIDAPMLEIDAARNTLPSSRFYEESPGRFVYVVNADREAERSGWSQSAEVKDDSATDYLGNPTGSQNGERKSLPFRTKNIVSSGEIVISSDKDIVVFYDKKFVVSNEPIKGTIRFGTTEQSSQPVPQGSFVPFEVLPTFNRIGVVTIGDDGNYELYMRGEYKYNWNTDDIKLQYVSGGVKYEKIFSSLSDLYNDRDILLTPVREG